MTYSEKNSRTTLVVVLSIVVLVVVGGVVALVVTMSGGRTSGTPVAAPRDDARPAAVRDKAMEDGITAAETLNTLDYRDAEKDMDRWESVATGDLLEELGNSRDQNISAVANARTTTTAKVQTAALAKLDTSRGTARLLVVTRVEIVKDGGEPTTKQLRLTLTIEETPDGWKVSAIDRK